MQDEREGESDDKTIKVKEKQAKDLGKRSDKNKYYKVSFVRKLGNSFSGWEEFWFYIYCPALRQAILALFLRKIFWWKSIKHCHVFVFTLLALRIFSLLPYKMPSGFLLL